MSSSTVDKIGQTADKAVAEVVSGRVASSDAGTPKLTMHDLLDVSSFHQAAIGMAQKTPIGESSHPIHPATVHLPIGLWTAAFTLNAAHYFTPGVFPKGVSQSGFLSRFVPPLAAVPAIAHYMNGAGLIFSTVTIASGVAELLGMWRGQAQQKGGYVNALKDAYTASPDDIAANKLKTTFTHATLNDLVCKHFLPIRVGLSRVVSSDIVHLIHATSRSCRVELLQASYIPNPSSAPHKCMAISSCSPSLLLFRLPVSTEFCIDCDRKQSLTC